MRSFTTSISTSTPPAPRAGSRSPWSQPWLLPVTAAMLLTTDSLPPELKVPGALACLLLLALALRGPTAERGGQTGGTRWAFPRQLLTGEHRWAANRQALFDLGDGLIARSTRHGQPVSVIVFEQADLPELHALFGAAAAQRLAGELGQRLALLARGHGLAVRTGASVWTLVLPGAGREAAFEAVREALGDSFALESDMDGEEIVLVPDFLIQPLTDDAMSLQSVYEDIRARIRLAHEHEIRRQHYLRRERESYTTRPMRMESGGRRRSAPAGYPASLPASVAA